jgi:hypothetical protein
MFTRRWVIATVAGGLLAVAAGGAQPVAGALAAPGSAPRPVAAAWLEGVTAISGRNVWAVGGFRHAGGAEPLIEHWNGRTWQVTRPYLNAPYNVDTFAGVAATSATSVWAAGSILSQYAFLFVEHWDGAAWSPENTPIVGPDDGTGLLSGVAAAPRSNAWAVGNYYGGPNGTIQAQLTLIVRWNARKQIWVQVPSPSPAGTGNGARSALNGVAALSRSDAWAVGAANSGPSGQVNTLIEHWDGGSWSVAPSPDPSRAGCVHDELLGVTAAPTATWAVGRSCGAALALRLAGGQWQATRTPGPSAGVSEQLASVAVTSTANAWAVGSIGKGPLILHWNGAKWVETRVPIPAGATSARLASVTAVSASAAWAVGQADYPHHVIRLLIERWNGTKWTQVRIPNPTS